jgi:predicted neuraminidase
VGKVALLWLGFYWLGFPPLRKRIIDMADLLGRKIVISPISDSDGTVILDTSSLAAGQYVILMKEDGAILKNIKLLVNK